MNLTITQPALVAALAKVSSVIRSKGTLPVLANVLLECSASTLALTGSDMEVEIQAEASPLDVQQPGGITVSGQKLFNLAKALPADGVIKLSLKDDKLTMSSGRSRYVLATLPVSEFPSSEKADAEHTLSLPAASLASMMERTSFAMASNDVRHYLNGALLVVEPGSLRMVATDGHRLAQADSPCESADMTRSAIIPSKAIAEILRLIKANSEGDVTLGFSTGSLSIKMATATMTTKLVDGRYPDYKAVVPAVTDSAIIMDRAALLASLGRVSLVAHEKHHSIALKTTKDSIQLSSGGVMNDGTEELDAEHSLKEMTLGFNVNYLRDSINSLWAEKVRIQVRDSNTSILITDLDPNGSKFRHVVMPLKL